MGNRWPPSLYRRIYPAVSTRRLVDPQRNEPQITIEVGKGVGAMRHVHSPRGECARKLAAAVLWVAVRGGSATTICPEMVRPSIRGWRLPRCVAAVGRIAVASAT